MKSIDLALKEALIDIKNCQLVELLYKFGDKAAKDERFEVGVKQCSKLLDMFD